MAAINSDSESDEQKSAGEEQPLLVSHNQSQCKVTISLLCMSLHDNITQVNDFGLMSSCTLK